MSDDAPASAELDLPRAQTGSSPQHLLTTLFGDFWLHTAVKIPSAFLVDLLHEFGVTPTAGRAAISRLSRRGLLVSQRSGRTTSYGLSEPARQTLVNGGRRIASFGLPGATWDAQWTVVTFSLPEHQRALRHAARGQLRWLGFAPLFDAVWVSPSADATSTLADLVGMGVSNVAVVRAHELPAASAGRSLLSAWDLEGQRDDYLGFITRHEPLRREIREGRVSASRALLTRTSLMDEYRRFPGRDPGLPDALMPDDWPRARTRALFAEVYDGLGTLAAVRVRQLLAERTGPLPALADSVREHTLAEMLTDRP